MKRSKRTTMKTIGLLQLFRQWQTPCPRSVLLRPCSALSKPWAPSVTRPEVLGKLIGGALVGTFLGVFVAYGMVGPIAQVLGTVHEAETKYYQCMKSGILAYLNGYAPAVCVEFARKALESDVRPTFYEVEEASSALPAIA